MMHILEPVSYASDGQVHCSIWLENSAPFHSLSESLFQAFSGELDVID
jgi:hypothetical protein